MRFQPRLSSPYSIVLKARQETVEPLLVVANTRHGPGAHTWPSREPDETPHDHLNRAEEAVNFLRENRVTVPHRVPTRADLAGLRAVREAVWALLADPGTAQPLAPSSLFARASYRLSADGRLEPTGQGWPAFIASLLPALVEARARRDQLKACGNPICGWIFLDWSKNRSRVWCDMAACGNRAKANRYQRSRIHP